MRSELLQYNNLIKEYKEYYFNVYSFLVSKGWVVDKYDINSDGELWTEWLFSPVINELFEVNTYTFDYEWLNDDKYKFDIFDLQVEDCTSIIPPSNFISNIDKESNVVDVITNYNSYNKEFSNILINSGWYIIEVKDVQSLKWHEEEPGSLILYISPDLDREFVEAFITKDNVYELLKQWSDYIVNSNIWWNYEQK